MSESNPGVKPVHQELDDELDNELLEQVKSGKASASLLNVARQRLKDLGFNKKLAPDSAAGQMAEELGLTRPDFKGGSLPPVSGEVEAI